MEGLKGELFTYGSRSFCAFESGQIASSKCLVLIGGLTDGLLTGLFNPINSKMLSSVVLENDISAIQYISTSSYLGYGTSSLRQDYEDLLELLNDLLAIKGKREIFLLGHSTGCQIIMTLLGNPKFRQDHDKVFRSLRGAILHGPVSDREFFFFSNPDQSSKLLQFSESVEENRLSSVLYPELIDGVAMSAYRIKSLLQKNGDDDFFSTDQTVDERKAKANNLGIPLLAVFNGCDQYFPFEKDRLNSLIDSMKAAWPEIEQSVIIDGADHGCRNGDSFSRLMDSVVAKIKSWTTA